MVYLLLIYYIVAGKKKAQKMSLSDFLADDSEWKLLFYKYSYQLFTCFFLLLATGNSSWADDVADLPSARKFLLDEYHFFFL